ncbi:MAG: hypothetical protein AB8U25_01490 [Rickettsiales endosymbiont of Dermacentor nuttalli]
MTAKESIKQSLALDPSDETIKTTAQELLHKERVINKFKSFVNIVINNRKHNTEARTNIILVLEPC